LRVDKDYFTLSGEMIFFELKLLAKSFNKCETITP